MFNTLFLISLASLLLTFVFTPAVILLAKKYKMMDNPRKRPHPAHTHKGVIPRAGGLAIILGIFIPLLIFITPSFNLFGVLIGAIILVAVGLWDDRKDRSPYIRFFFNCLAALAAVSFGITIPYITNPFGGIIHLDIWKYNFDLFGPHSIIILANIAALVWIVWTTNIIGWSGGIDGQLPGFVSISSFVIGLLSLRYASLDPNQLQVTYLSFATAGAFLGFLPWNFYPQKIMPGYGGKTLAGFMLAVLSILSFSKLGTSLLVLVVPMTDAVFMLIKRILSGKSPVWATSGHLHHHLLSLGWGRRRIALFYWIISLLAGLAALFLNSKQKVFAALLLIVAVLMFIIGINFLVKLTIKSKIEEN